jgi:tRNA pseudouridine55 synthase
MARKKANTRDVAGFLLFDKPSGMTSNSALQRVKRLFNAAKAGHTGSLDPLATGMLPLCFGAATKAAQFGLAADKTYRVTARLGVKTDTDDADGQVVAEAEVGALSEADVRQALAALRGEISQVPPMYSALKHAGRRLYALAREGIEVERQARSIHIRSIELERLALPEIEFRVACSKGTYVRTLVVDLARSLGTLGHVTALRRIAVEPFGESPMCTLAQLEALAQEDAPEALDALLMEPDAVLRHLPRVDVQDELAMRLRQGQSVGVAAALAEGQVRVYAAGGPFVGIAELDGAGKLMPRRIFL